VVADLGIKAVGMFLYAYSGLDNPLSCVMGIRIVDAIGNARFFPANNAVMKGLSRGSYSMASEILRTVSNIGMILSFASAMVVAVAQIPRTLAFANFVGITSLKGLLMVAFNHMAIVLVRPLLQAFSMLCGPF
jgi:adenosylmethionine-8-amino-7-oxononanoate aminotransferase